MDDTVEDPVAYMRAVLAQDFACNPYWPQKLTLFVLRAGRAWHNQPGIKAFVIRRALQILKLLWLEGHIGAEVPNQTIIGPGLFIPHNLRGVMLHPQAVIGANAKLFHQTVLGVRDMNGAPVVGDDVEIGAGAKVLGNVHIADGTKIGANAVVVKDTEPGGTYVGVPAKRVKSRSERATERRDGV